MNVDLIIKNGLVLTIDSELRIFDKGDVIIQNGEIIDVLKSGDQQYSPKEVIDATDKLVMPGLVNTHTHTGNTIYRGFADDLPLKTWLEDYIFPVEKQFCTAETVRLSTQLTVIELIKSGTTTFSDMYYFEDEVAKVVDEVGIRAELGETLIDFPSPTVESAAKAIEYSEELIKNWNDHPLIKIAITPHAPYTCGTETLQNGKALADKYGVSFHMHVSESKFEIEKSMQDHGASPVQYLNSIGCFEGNTFAVHCVHLSEDDKELFVKNQVPISHNPQSNMKISSGIAPIDEAVKMGILVGIGTDGSASNNNLSMIEEMDFASKLQKVATMDPTSLDAKTVVKMGTIDGARLLRMDDKIGSIEKGKRADIILIDLNHERVLPMYDPYSHIVFAMNGTEVDTSIVDGKIIMENRELRTIDESKVLNDIKVLGAKIKSEFNYPN
ncbi:amidohydrolase [bacterium AH-315-C07]|nr:amidohydrolase [bacterium AH-315-C07]